MPDLALAVLLAAALVALVVVLVRLRRSDARFAAAMDGLKDPVYVQETGSGKLIYANRRYRDVFSAEPPRFDDAYETQSAGRRFVLRASPLPWTDGREATL